MYTEAVQRYLESLKDALIWAAQHRDIVETWVADRSGISREIIKYVLNLHDNLQVRFQKKKDIDITLPENILGNLIECNTFLIQNKQIPSNFDITSRIKEISQ